MPSTPVLGPLHVLVGRAQEEDVQPDRVGAVALDEPSGPSTLPFVFDIFDAALP